MFRGLLLSLVLVAGLSAAAAAGPMIHHIEAVAPRCGQRGTTVEVTLSGVSLAKPQDVVFFRPGIRAVEVEEQPALPEPINTIHSGFMKESVRCVFEIAPDCPLGEHPFRLRTATELTGLGTFHVTRFPNVDETEKGHRQNDTCELAQPVPMNSTVRGRMLTTNVADVDVYRVAGRGGQHLSVEVDSVWMTDRHYGNSECDLAVRVLDDRGQVIVQNDDSALHIQDPIVSTVLPRDADYFVEIRQRIAHSGGQIFYAAHIGENHRPLAIYPAGGRGGEKLSATLLGDPAGDEPISVETAPEPGDFAFNDNMPSSLPMRISPYENVLEAPGDGPTVVEHLPAALNGIIEKPGDTDVFRLSVHKGDRYRVRVYGRSLGTPIDPRLSITAEGADSPEIEGDDSTYPDRGLYAVGQQLQRKELLDPSLVWEPRTDGVYQLAISDMRSLGGPTFVYRIEIEAAHDGVNTVPYSRVIDNVECYRLTSFAVPQGNRWTVNIALSEEQGNRYHGELDLVAVGLPAGVQMIAPRVKPGEKIVPVEFVAGRDARPQVALFQILVRAVGESHDFTSGSQQAFPFLGHSGGAAWRSVVVDHYALAVTDPAPYSLEVQRPRIPLALNGELALEVDITRQPGFDEPIEFQADWVPPGVASEPTVTVSSGENHAVFRLSASGSAKPGKWPLALTASTTGGSYYLGAGRIRVSTSMIDLEIAEPYVALKNQPAAIRRGQQAQVVWDVEHKKPLPGQAEAVLVGLPKGVTLVGPPPRLAAGDRQLVFNLEADREVLLGQYRELSCEIVVHEAGQEIRQRTGKGILRVDPSLDSATQTKTP
ncbi:MAG TPA: serine protease [Pirellulales bacterium]|nr:serine protease [Pirellulales bacterium]